MASSWRSPPERNAVSRPAKWAIRVSSITSWMRRRMSAGAIATFSGPKASSDSTVEPTICFAGSWSSVPTTWLISRRRISTVGRPSISTAPPSSPL